MINGSHVETLTFGGQPSAEDAMIEFRRHLHDLERQPSLEPKSDVQLEAERRQDLLDAKKRLRQKKWYRGNAKVEAYDPERGWTHYMMKNVSGSIIDYQFTVGKTFGKRHNIMYTL